MKKALTIIESNNFQGIRELNIIIKISQSIIGTLDFQKVLQIISDGMSELLEIETAAIYLLESEEELLLGATTPPLDSHMPDSLRKALLTDHPHIQKVILARQPILLPDTNVARLSPAEKNIVEMRRLRSLLFLPFVQEDKVLGVLILGTCNKSRTYTDHEIDLGQTVANQLSVAIQNSRFHSYLENNKNNLEKIVAERTRELEETNEELHTINEELQEKNELILQQKEEIEAAFDNLKSVQVKLFQSEKMASLGVLTAGVAHEINNPLNFIMGAYQGLKGLFTSTAPEHKEDVSVLLNGLKTGVERASAIVQGLNQFSRDSKTYDEDCNVHSIMDNCLLMLHNQYINKINIDKLYEKGDLIVKGNVGKLHQAFINILTNSVEAIEKNGLITISTHKNMDTVSISISDTGCGIKKENLHKITDPFFTTREPQKGTGLGLSITYNIIRDHKGQLEFESEINKGTTVKIILPVNSRQ
jgi:signal transduction histidine kinase